MCWKVIATIEIKWLLTIFHFVLRFFSFANRNCFFKLSTVNAVSRFKIKKNNTIATQWKSTHQQKAMLKVKRKTCSFLSLFCFRKTIRIATMAPLTSRRRERNAHSIYFQFHWTKHVRFYSNFNYQIFHSMLSLRFVNIVWENFTRKKKQKTAQRT